MTAATSALASAAASTVLARLQDGTHEPDQGRWYGHMPLSAINFDEGIKNYRGKKTYSLAQLENLRKSLTVKGKLNLLNPLHTVVDEKAGVLRTIGGNRRLASLKALTEKDNNGQSTLSVDALIPVYVYETSDRCEALRRAMTDNAFRRDFSDFERLTAIEDMDRASMSATDIAGSMNISDDTVSRFMAIARHATLKEFLQKGTLPYSKLAQLGKCIEKGDKVSGWITDLLTAWRKKAVAEKKTMRPTADAMARRLRGRS